MKRMVATFLLASLGLAAAGAAAPAKMVAMRPATERALASQTVVVGKVTAIENDPVMATPAPGAQNKVEYKVAVVQVQSALAGVSDVTHIKVGFVPHPPQVKPLPAQPGQVRPFIVRRGPILPELKVGQEYVFFLSKHADAAFFVMSPMSPPLDPKVESTKKEVESIKKALAVVADPMKALKAASASDRAYAAATLVMKYRSYPGVEAEQAAIPAEESRLILKGIAEADWEKYDRAAPNGMRAYSMLGLMEKPDGWVPPKFVPARPGQPPVNYNALTKQAFVKWLAGPGQDYRIKRFVPKKK